MSSPSIMEKAMKLAEADLVANGSYLNAPYTIYDNDSGEYFKAKIHTNMDRDTREVASYTLIITRPEKHVDSANLPPTQRIPR